MRAKTTKQNAESAMLQTWASGFDELEERFDALIRRGYELVAGNGRVFGPGLDDWLQSQGQMLNPVAVTAIAREEILAPKVRAKTGASKPSCGGIGL